MNKNDFEKLPRKAVEIYSLNIIGYKGEPIFKTTIVVSVKAKNRDVKSLRYVN